MPDKFAFDKRKMQFKKPHTFRSFALKQIYFKPQKICDAEKRWKNGNFTFNQNRNKTLCTHTHSTQTEMPKSQSSSSSLSSSLPQRKKNRFQTEHSEERINHINHIFQVKKTNENVSKMKHTVDLCTGQNSIYFT